MREVCEDVKIELLPLDANQIRNGNIADKVHLDVFENGVWGPLEKNIGHSHFASKCYRAYILPELNNCYCIMHTKNKNGV